MKEKLFDLGKGKSKMLIRLNDVSKRKHIFLSLKGMSIIYISLTVYKEFIFKK